MNRYSSPTPGAGARGPAAASVRSGGASLTAALASVGAATLTVQVLLLRELMTAWRGNEMSFGIVMTVWLLTGGIGSVAYGLVARRVAPTRGALARGLVALGAHGARRSLHGKSPARRHGTDDRRDLRLRPAGRGLGGLARPRSPSLAGLLFALSTSIVHDESRLANGRRESVPGRGGGRRLRRDRRQSCFFSRGSTPYRSLSRSRFSPAPCPSGCSSPLRLRGDVRAARSRSRPFSRSRRRRCSAPCRADSTTRRSARSGGTSASSRRRIPSTAGSSPRAWEARRASTRAASWRRRHRT